LRIGRRNCTSVFISYARADGAELARRLCQDLNSAGFDAWLDTQRIAAGATWTAEIEREIDSRPVMLALLTPGSYRSEICRAEQLRGFRLVSADCRGRRWGRVHILALELPDGERL